MVVHVSPLSFPHWGSAVVRVGCLMLWPVRLVTEPSSRAVMVSGWTVATTSASGVGASVPSSISGADAWHVSPLGHYLQDKGSSLLVRTNLVKKKHWTHPRPFGVLFSLPNRKWGYVQYTRQNIIFPVYSFVLSKTTLTLFQPRTVQKVQISFFPSKKVILVESDATWDLFPLMYWDLTGIIVHLKSARLQRGGWGGGDKKKKKASIVPPHL